MPNHSYWTTLLPLQPLRKKTWHQIFRQAFTSLVNKQLSPPYPSVQTSFINKLSPIIAYFITSINWIHHTYPLMSDRQRKRGRGEETLLLPHSNPATLKPPTPLWTPGWKKTPLLLSRMFPPKPLSLLIIASIPPLNSSTKKPTPSSMRTNLWLIATNTLLPPLKHLRTTRKLFKNVTPRTLRTSKIRLPPLETSYNNNRANILLPPPQLPLHPDLLHYSLPSHGPRRLPEHLPPPPLPLHQARRQPLLF